jgi:hypothetical protein
VLLISIDGLRPDNVLRAGELGLKVPNLCRLRAEGACATGVTGVLPTGTYPSHTTLPDRRDSVHARSGGTTPNRVAAQVAACNRPHEVEEGRQSSGAERPPSGELLRTPGLRLESKGNRFSAAELHRQNFSFDIIL